MYHAALSELISDDCWIDYNNIENNKKREIRSEYSRTDFEGYDNDSALA